MSSVKIQQKLMKVVIKDFQSLEEVKLTVKGLTLLVGESGAGKSSVCRALQAALFNRFKGGQVRFGQDHATVKVLFEDNEEPLVVQRSWAGGSPLIKLGNQVYSKLGRNLPKEVSEHVNFANLDLGGDTYSCNIHPQFQRPLLLEFSQQKVMELLSASSALDDLKEAKEVVLGERQRVKGAVQAVDSMLETVTKQVNEGATLLLRLEPVVSNIESTVDEITEIEENQAALYEYQQLLTECSVLERQESILNSLIECYKQHVTLDVGRETLLSVIPTAKEVSFYETIEPLLVKVIESLKPITTLDVVEQLKALLVSDSVISSEENSELKKFNILDSLVKKTEELRDLYGKRQTLSLTKPILDSYRDLKSEEATLVDFVENKVCPICGNKIE